MQAKMERVESEREAERAEREADQQRMAEILQYMQSLGAATGVAPSPSLFAPSPPPPPPPPPHYSTPVYSCLWSNLVEYESFILVRYIFILSHTCNLFFFVQNQSTTSNDPHASANPSPNQ